MVKSNTNNGNEMTHEDYIQLATTDLLGVAASKGLEGFNLTNVRYSYCNQTLDFDCLGDLCDDSGRPIFTVHSERYL